jgi:hypothetical protein
MSYDVDLVTPACEHCGRGGAILFEVNYTSNMRGAWNAAGIKVHEWEGVKAASVVEQLRAGLAAIAADLPKYRAFEPDNGWGHVSTMVDNFLRPILEACEAHPNAVIRVSR